MLGGRGGPFLSIVEVVPRRRWQLRACSAFDYPVQQLLLYYATIARSPLVASNRARHALRALCSLRLLRALCDRTDCATAHALQCVD